ncbi:MAG TPA: NAD(P)H-dependent oxidoreductase [Tissierellia bacterium]|nr:NAD(P)H-dependent oxidoreductase [Tissierellia bacterium]
MSLQVVRSNRPDRLLDQMLEHFQADHSFEGEKVVFGLSLDEYGRDDHIYQRLKDDPEAFRSGVGSVLITSSSDLYTKEAAKEIIHLLNGRGMEFPGHSVIEAIQDLKNMRKWARNLETDRLSALLAQARQAGQRLAAYTPTKVKKLLVLHANSRPDRSNTMQLFREVEHHLKIDYLAIEILDEHIRDCAGCSYKTCGYYSSIQSCHFGGLFTDRILQQIDQAGALLLLAPNYNDALSAKMMAVVNRLSVLYRRGPFYDKYVFALVVSGNSGSDSVARQIIGAYHINKGFRLPARFYQQAIANDPGEILQDRSLQTKTGQFARDLMRYIE